MTDHRLPIMRTGHTIVISWRPSLKGTLVARSGISSPSAKACPGGPSAEIEYVQTRRTRDLSTRPERVGYGGRISCGNNRRRSRRAEAAPDQGTSTARRLLLE